MSRNIWIGLVVVVVLVAGGWWYFNQSSAPATSETTQLPTEQTTQPSGNNSQPVVNTQPSQFNQPAQTSTKPSATIDKSSLTTNSSTPVITGTVSNTSELNIVIAPGTKVPAWLEGWSVSSDTGAITITNGRWSMGTYGYTGHTFSNGTYTVAVYGANNVLLTSGTLVVSGLAVAPTCNITVNPSTTTIGQQVNVSWSSQNATEASWLYAGPGNNALYYRIQEVIGSSPSTNGSIMVTASKSSDITQEMHPDTSSATLNVTGPGGQSSCVATVNWK